MVHFQATMFLKTVRKISPLLKIQKAVKSVCLILLCPNDFFLWKYFILNTVFKTFFSFILTSWYTFQGASQVALVVKNLPANVGDMGLIPGSERSPGEGNDYPLQYSCWRIPWTEEPGGLWFMGSQRVRHNWSSLACMYAFIPNQSNVL